LNNRCTAKKVAEVSHFHRLDFSPESIKKTVLSVDGAEKQTR